jgi:hypothetical protein
MTASGRIVGQMDFLNAYQVETSGTTEADLVAALATAGATAGVTIAAPNQAWTPTRARRDLGHPDQPHCRSAL